MITDILNEVAKIHSQYGITETANIKIQQLCERFARESLHKVENSEFRKWRRKTIDDLMIKLDSMKDEIDVYKKTLETLY